MTTYTWTAKDRDGNSVVKQIAHESPDGAKAVLLAEGYTDLKLIEDDIMHAVQQGFDNRITVMGEEVKVTAADRVKAMNNSPATFTRILLDGIRLSWKFILIFVVAAAVQVYLGHPVGAGLIVLGLLFWLAFLIAVGLPSVYYNKLHRAADWNRWTEVLQLVDTLKKMRTFHFIKVPETELARYRSKALAGMGDLPHALAEYAPCENQPGCPSWLYKAMVASLYDTAKQYDKALELTWESLKDKPRSTLYLDLANRLLRRKRDVAGAKWAIAQAETSTMTEIAKPFYWRVLGILAYLEGQYPVAKEKLESVIDALQRKPGQPYRDGHMAIARAYLACVNARLGDTPAARKCLAEAREYLVATDEDELIAECEREVPKA